MATGARLVGTRELRRNLDRINPSKNRVINERFLNRAMLTVLRNSARVQILPGGKGPPRVDRLTSRTGALRRSLGLRESIDRRGFPNSIEGGTSLIYGGVHERTKRKFLQPALDAIAPEFEAVYIEEWKREL